MSSSNFGPLSRPICCALWTMTRATPYWVASCFRAGGAIVGATASMSRSNSARVTTVLQFAGLDFARAGLSHIPGIVITAASRGTAPLPGDLAAGWDTAGALGGGGGADGFAACPQASVGRKNRHIHFHRG